MKSLLTNLSLPLFVATAPTIQGVTSEGLGSWLITLAAVSIIITQVMNVVDRFSGQGRRRQVTTEEPLATVKQLTKVEEDLNKEDTQLHGRISELRRTTEEKLEKHETALTKRMERLEDQNANTHDRINDVLKSLGDIKQLIGPRK